MNEYQARDAAERAVARSECEAIAEALGEDWHVLPDPPDLGYSRWHYLSDGNGRELVAEVLWNRTDRFEFHPAAWPSYTDKDGRKQTVTPSDCWTPSEIVPKCTAARTRAPLAIAREIERKILPEYDRLRARCADIAANSQKHNDKEAELISLLFKATREQRNPEKPEQKPRFVREIDGPTLAIEYRSGGSVKIDIGTEEMAAVIEFLRERRANA